jgi:general secretion pathway protein A
VYLSFYQLDKKPFEITADPKFLWLSEKHKEPLAKMQYGILENKGCLMLTGDVGTGKTTLIHALLETLGNDVITATINDPDLDTSGFFTILAAAFKMESSFDSKASFILHFSEFLNTAFVQNKKVLLIIDEAQRATPEVLEELRNLSNLEKHYTKLVNIFFVGQKEFNSILRRPELRALRQRIIIDHYIGPLTREETGEYIHHRLKVAGSKKMLFEPRAVDQVHKLSRGYPRLINIVCDIALVSGYVDGDKVIKPKTVKECTQNLSIHSDLDSTDRSKSSETITAGLPSAGDQNVSVLDSPRKRKLAWLARNLATIFKRQNHRAIQSNVDSGKFYRGNVQSHKFHKSGCPFNNCKNCTKIFKSRESAIKEGYMPAGCCKP